MWFVLTSNKYKANHTAHKNPLCPNLHKFNSKKYTPPKRLTQVHELKHLRPCKICDKEGFYSDIIKRFSSMNAEQIHFILWGRKRRTDK